MRHSIGFIEAISFLNYQYIWVTKDLTLSSRLNLGGLEIVDNTDYFHNLIDLVYFERRNVFGRTKYSASYS